MERWELNDENWEVFLTFFPKNDYPQNDIQNGRNINCASSDEETTTSIKPKQLEESINMLLCSTNPLCIVRVYTDLRKFGRNDETCDRSVPLALNV